MRNGQLELTPARVGIAASLQKQLMDRKGRGSATIGGWPPSGPGGGAFCATEPHPANDWAGQGSGSDIGIRGPGGICPFAGWAYPRATILLAGNGTLPNPPVGDGGSPPEGL